MTVFLLIILAAGFAVAAHFTETLYFGIAAVAVALVSVLLVAGCAWADRRARQQEPAPAQAGAGKQDDDIPDEQPTGDEDSAAPTHSEAAESLDSMEDERETGHDEAAVPIAVVEPETDTVRVIPGRNRFHEPGCSSLTGRKSEELTRAEAEEEGFTPCSMCSGNTGITKKIG